MHKDYLPDVTQPESNTSDYEQEEEEDDEQAEDNENEYDEYQDNLHNNEWEKEAVSQPSKWQTQAHKGEQTLRTNVLPTYHHAPSTAETPPTHRHLHWYRDRLTHTDTDD